MFLPQFLIAPIGLSLKSEAGLNRSTQDFHFDLPIEASAPRSSSPAI